MAKHKVPNPDPTRVGRRCLMWLCGFLLGSALLFVLPLCHDFDLRRLVTALIWALACLASGVAVGFLFGVPRVDQRKPETPAPAPGGPPTPPTEPEYSQRVNTNLEEISDWLTKIIVGLGLVELRNIPGHLDSLADLLAQCLGDHCSHALASALIIWYAILGFFIGYLVTRIYLAFAFGIADRMSRDAMKWLSDLTRRRTETFASEVATRAADEVAERTADSLAAVSRGLSALAPNAHPRDVEVAISTLADSLHRYPTVARAAIVLARLYRWKKHNLATGIQILTTAIDAMRQQGIADKGLATLLFNRACYQVQLAQDLDPTARQARLEHADVKGDLAECFRIMPSFAADARADSDFAPIVGEPWMVELLTQYDPHPGGQPAPAAPPVVEAIAIIPDNPVNTATLTAQPTGTSVGGGTVSFTYQWQRNGAPIPGAAAAMLVFSSVPNLAVNDRLTVEVTPSDGTRAGSPLTSAAVRLRAVGPNQIALPTATVTIGPDRPEAPTMLVATATATEPDPPVSFKYQWLKNDAILAGQTAPTLALGAASPAVNDVFKVEVTASTAALTGGKVESNAITVTQVEPEIRLS